LTIFPPRREKQRTVCVLGAPRGGTSMIAGILRKVGVFMGDEINEANNEDHGFLAHGGRRAIFFKPERAGEKADFLAHAAKLVRSRNADHDLWGWKDPIAAHYISDLNPQLRNPVFIVVTRDLGAIAQREHIEEEGAGPPSRALSYLKFACEEYVMIADFIGARARPTLLVSYERALRAPAALGRAIAEFVGVTPSQDYESWVQEYVAPDRLTGALQLGPKHASTRQFASTTAVQALVNESLRVRHDGFGRGAAPKKAEIGLAGSKLYSAAVAALNQRQYRDAQENALAIINLYAPSFPVLSDGAIGILAEDLAGGGQEIVYPDLVCGAFYLLGMSSLLLASAQPALIYFTITERMMRTRLMRQVPGSILSEGNFWMCVFHKGLAAKTMQRQHVVDEVIRAISEAASADPSAGLAPLATTRLAEARKRVTRELSPR
jgi:hypothetical protein